MPDPTDGPHPFDVALDLVNALAGAIIASLGDLPKQRDVQSAAFILARQVDALADLVHDALAEQIRPAFKSYVSMRVRPHLPDAETLEKALTDSRDPNHVFWLAIVPRHLLRRYCASVVNPREINARVYGPISFNSPEPEE